MEIKKIQISSDSRVYLAECLNNKLLGSYYVKTNPGALVFLSDSKLENSLKEEIKRNFPDVDMDRLVTYNKDMRNIERALFSQYTPVNVESNCRLFLGELLQDAELKPGDMMIFLGDKNQFSLVKDNSPARI